MFSGTPCSVYSGRTEIYKKKGRICLNTEQQTGNSRASETYFSILNSQRGCILYVYYIFLYS